MRFGDIRTRDATGSNGTVLVQLQSLTCLGGGFGDRCLSPSCQYIMDHDSRCMSWTPYTFMQTAKAEERPNAVQAQAFRVRNDAHPERYMCARDSTTPRTHETCEPAVWLAFFLNVLLGNSTYSVSKFCILASTSVGKMAGNATIRACTQRQERHCARYVEQERLWPRLPPFLSRGRLSSGGSSLSVVQGGTRAY